jgi:hypothetical protein
MKPAGHKTITDADQQIRDYYDNEPPSETEAFPPPRDREHVGATERQGRAIR